MEALAARLEAEQTLSSQLSAAAQDLQRRARAQRSLLTLELVQADDELCAAHAAVILQQRETEYAHAREAQLRGHLEVFVVGGSV